MLKIPPLSLYIHIPWCIKKCPYCDFNSHLLKNKIPSKEYVRHLLADLDADLSLIKNRKIVTIFIGGGTPSLLSQEAIRELLDGIRSRLSIFSNAEITIEVNPDAISYQYFENYKKAGINRISLGIQSFNDEKLYNLGRIHNSKEAKKIICFATNCKFHSINLDLMYGLPNQSLKEALYDLNQAIAINPSHLSWYQLMIEPNTLFSLNPPTLPSHDYIWKIFKKGHQLLINSGYFQYEISSYAHLGYQCQHNLNYWRFGDYLGIGCGAHSKLTFINNNIVRIIKTKHPFGFMKGTYIDKKSNVSLKDRSFEFFLNRFRLLEKIPRSDFINYTGLTENIIRSPLNKAFKIGFLKEESKYWLITKKGQMFLDSLLELFLP
ncbi:Oxygen-independent coproporphyrinogen-III oxidase-like protein YqeR [Candidatus Ecksteinia adelgidicola]|nr:Oxygen-independent coproporphyrinogen-III oxidase-like protein YqeR [Candidatus Ecksteinia adelgidicola]